MTPHTRGIILLPEARMEGIVLMVRHGVHLSAHRASFSCPPSGGRVVATGGAQGRKARSETRGIQFVSEIAPERAKEVCMLPCSAAPLVRISRRVSFPTGSAMLRIAAPVATFLAPFGGQRRMHNARKEVGRAASTMLICGAASHTCFN